MDTSGSKFQGYIMALTAAMLWGVSGACVQFLFQQKGIPPEWLVTIRMLFSGTVLLLIGYFQSGTSVFDIWKDKKDRWKILSFGWIGMLSVQYTYFVAIGHSNAATATILQYLGPVIIAVYVCLKEWRIPKWYEIVALVCAVFGVFLLVTHGNMEELSISEEALFWGILSAFALAVYTLQPIELLQKYASTSVVGWGMLIGGISFSLVQPPWEIEGIIDFEAILNIAFVVIFGTLIAFYIFLVSVKKIGGVEASLLACAEPLSATVIALTWLQVPFTWMDWVGGGSIIATIVLLSMKDLRLK